MAIFNYCPPKTPWLEIVYQDRDMLVINKPAWLLSVPGKHIEHSDSIYTRVRAEFSEAQIVHRLDMATSGLIVMALHKDAERNIKIQFQERIPKKEYIARVWGHPRKNSGTIDLPLICDWPNRPKQKVCYSTGKNALTHYNVIKVEEHTTLMRLMPHTGRSHQLRVHMQQLGHPIVGDRLYAHDAAIEYSPNRTQLHAAKITLLHPRTDEQVTFFYPHSF